LVPGRIMAVLWRFKLIVRREEDIRTHVETARINDLIGLQIGAIQEEAQKLNVDSDLQEIEANIAALEKRGMSANADPAIAQP